MIKDLLVSFTENIKSKTTNPFFGTLIIVWILHNWRMIYTLFNFEETQNLQSRNDFLSQYLDPQYFIPNLALCIGSSFIVLIITYSLLNLSRLIVNYFEKIVTPFVYKWTDKSSIVLKRDYDLLKQEKFRFEKKFEEERETRLKWQNEYEVLEKKLQDQLNKDQNKTKKVIEPKQKGISRLNELLNNSEAISDFKKMTEVILNKRYVNDSATTSKMLNLNLVQKGNSDINDRYNYNFTTDGQKLRDLLLDKEIKE